MDTSDHFNHTTIDSQLEPLKETYEIIRILGEGSNGKTWLAKQRDNGRLVAIKALKFSDDEKQLELFKREAHTLKNLNVNGIPKFLESVIPDNPMTDMCYIIQEYVQLQSLQSYLDKNKRFSEQATILVLEKLTKILHVLQAQYVPPIIHRDIKPSNILSPSELKENSPLYLIDFGAVANPQKKNGGSTIAGTFGYMAPEQLLGDVTIQSDYFAMGATAVHLITGVSPSAMTSNVYRLNIDEVIRSHAPHTSRPMLHLLHWLLEPSVADRPKNTAILLKAILAVKSKKDFVIGSKMEYPDVFVDSFGNSGFKGWFERHFNYEPALDRDVDFFLDPKFWKQVNGTLRHIADGIDEKKEQKYFEYTFTVNGQSYVGLTEVPHDGFEIGNLPMPCVVQYNPKDPRMNRMVLENGAEDKN